MAVQGRSVAPVPRLLLQPLPVTHGSYMMDIMETCASSVSASLLHHAFLKSNFGLAFVSSSPIISFSGDLMAFLNYLSTNNGLSKSQYLIVLQGGTEPFIGTSVQLTTTQFTMALNTGSPSATSTSPGVTSTSQTSSTTSGSQTGTIPTS